jgi:hypothetical protein
VVHLADTPDDQETLNWMCPAGAMEKCGRQPEIVDWIESWPTNAKKCVALFTPSQ